MMQVKSHATPPILEIRPGVADEAPASQPGRWCETVGAHSPSAAPAERHIFSLYRDPDWGYLLQHAAWGTLALPGYDGSGRLPEVGRLGGWIPGRQARGAVAAHYGGTEYRRGEPVRLVPS